MTVDEESAQDRPEVILAPDQRAWVFLSSTLEELVARRAVWRLQLVPV